MMYGLENGLKTLVLLVYLVKYLKDIFLSRDIDLLIAVSNFTANNLKKTFSRR
ncbi:hypothetical protein [Methanobrevibacter arboriphilus]|uniref:hypothetical protein n=1 Tax=Methanobrevibacter arboriphilus TaxID=39441 RepID=UPI000A823768|nr:hypothetical protein [Methanobrevibacter arboriphilus]